MRWPSLLVLAACAPAPVPTAPTIANVSAAKSPGVVSACPVLLGGGWPWTTELFPSCPAAQFETPFPICVGTCPTPCGVSGERTNTMDSYRFAYDERHRLIARKHDNDTDMTIRYKGELVESCIINHGFVYTLERGPHGEILEVFDSGAPRKRYIYANGDLVEMEYRSDDDTHWIMEERFDYVEHRLVAQHAAGERTFTFRYEGGRLAERDEHFGDETIKVAYGYDGRGRLVSASSTPSTDDESSKFTLAFTYDAADRIASIARTHGGEVESETYEYCP